MQLIVFAVAAAGIGLVLAPVVNTFLLIYLLCGFCVGFFSASLPPNLRPDSTGTFIALTLLSPILTVGILIEQIQRGISKHNEARALLVEEARIDRAAQAAAAKLREEEKARKEKQQRINNLGEENAEFVECALAAVTQVGASEAASTGWLGDADFTADIEEITANFQKAHALRQVANKLSALDKPSEDDRRILAEANTSIANLELTAIQRVELIVQCAEEARLVDKSLSDKRKDALTAEQRAELHAKLSGMLYGIEATPTATSRESGVDGVMARVQAYREVMTAIQQARGDSSGSGRPLPPGPRSNERR